MQITIIKAMQPRLSDKSFYYHLQQTVVHASFFSLKKLRNDNDLSKSSILHVTIQ